MGGNGGTFSMRVHDDFFTGWHALRICKGRVEQRLSQAEIS